MANLIQQNGAIKCIPGATGTALALERDMYLDARCIVSHIQPTEIISRHAVRGLAACAGNLCPRFECADQASARGIFVTLADPAEMSLGSGEDVELKAYQSLMFLVLPHLEVSVSGTGTAAMKTLKVMTAKTAAT